MKKMICLIVTLLICSFCYANEGNKLTEKKKYERIGDNTVDLETNKIIIMHNVKSRSYNGTIEDIAKKFLRENKNKLSIVDEEVFKTTSTIQLENQNRVILQQYYGEVPVLDGKVYIDIDNTNRVKFVINNSKELGFIEKVPRVTKEKAIKIAQKSFLNNKIVFKESPYCELFVSLQDDQKTRLVWRLLIDPINSKGLWKFLIDANTGEILKKADVIRYSGKVFNPDPVSHMIEACGESCTMPSDNNDADNSVYFYYSTENLNHLTPEWQSDGTYVYKMVGTYAKSVTPNGVAITDFSEPDFNYNRSQRAFEEVNVYFHITNFVDNSYWVCSNPLPTWNENGSPKSYICFDAHSSDDSGYIPQGYGYDDDPKIRFSDDGVDNAEDQDVIVHEFGHAIHDAKLRASGQGMINCDSGHEEQSIEEGFADYIALSYRKNVLNVHHKTETLGLWCSGINGTRSIDWTLRYPDAWVGQECHDAGRLWCAAMMDLENRVGRDIASILFFKACQYYAVDENTSASMVIEAMIDADKASFNNVYEDDIRGAFGSMGFPVNLTSVTDAIYLLDETNFVEQGQTYYFRGRYDDYHEPITHLNSVDYKLVGHSLEGNFELASGGTLGMSDIFEFYLSIPTLPNKTWHRSETQNDYIKATLELEGTLGDESTITNSYDTYIYSPPTILGTLTNNEEWCGTIAVVDDVTIPNGISLYIKDNTNISFLDDSKLIVECGGAVVEGVDVNYYPSKNIIDDCIGVPEINSVTSGSLVSRWAQIIFEPAAGIDIYKLHWETLNDGSRYAIEKTFNMNTISLNTWVDVDFFIHISGPIRPARSFSKVRFEDVIQNADGSVTLIMRFFRETKYQIPYEFKMAAVNDGGFTGDWSPDVMTVILHNQAFRFAGSKKIYGGWSPLGKAASTGYQLEGESFIPLENGSTQPASMVWSKYNGPGNITFSNANDPLTTFSVDESGLYTLKIDSPTPEADEDSYDLTQMMIYTEDQFSDWEVVYQDHFSDQDVSDWTFSYNNWEVGPDSGNNALYIRDTWFTQKSGGLPGTLALIDSAYYEDFILSFKARTTETVTDWWDDFCVVFNYRNEDNYYFLDFDRIKVDFYKVEGGEKFLIASDKSYPINDGSYHDFEIIRVGSNLSVQRGDGVLLLATDDTFTKGQIGFGSLDDDAAFADVEIQADPYNLPSFMPWAFEDNFNDCDAIDWSPNAPSRWSIGEVDGSSAYKLNSVSDPWTTEDRYNTYGRVDEYTLVNDMAFTDFDFSCKAKLLEPIASDLWWEDICVLFGYQNNNNYYYMEFTKSWEATALVKVVNGVATMVARPGIQVLDDNDYHRLKVRREGNSVFVYFDNTQILTTTDATFGSGKIGIGSHNDLFAFDNVTIDANPESFVAPPEDPLVFSDNFIDMDSEGWTFSDSTYWSVVSQDGNPALSIVSGDYPWLNYGVPGTFTLIDSLYFKDFHFRCRAKITDAPENCGSGFGFIFGYQNESNYYFMDFSYVCDRTKLYRIIGGVATEIMKSPVPCHLWDADYHQIDIIREGSAIVVRSGGQNVLYLYDETFGLGQIGVGSASYHHTAAFDNVEIFADSLNVLTRRPIQFFDDFEDGNATGWTANSTGRWYISTDNNSKVLKINTFGNPWSNYDRYGTIGRLDEYTLIDNLSMSDFVFTCQARTFVNPVDWWTDICVVFGYQNANNYYYMEFTKAWDSSGLVKVVNGTASYVARPCIQLLTNNNYHTLKVQRIGQQVTVYFDANQILNVSAATFGAGQIGVGTHNDITVFDNISITEPALGKGLESETIQALPKTYDLSQNYPNPFNPETRIKYQLPELGDVKLVVYDIIGRAVRTLVNAKQTPGYYDLIWDSRNDSGNKVSTGIYIFRIQVDGEKEKFVKTKKMVVLK